MPWAVLRSPSGIRKPTGITNPLLAEVKAPRAEARQADRQASRPARRTARGTRRGAAGGRRPDAAPGGSPRRPPTRRRARRARSPSRSILSPEGLARLQAELDGLLAERPEVIKRIATAREHGDLKENAEYHAAREEQGFLEGRIKALEAKLKVAVVVAPTERGAVVGLGSRVRVEVDGEETEMQVVSSAEANSREGRISSSSPVGAALMGRRVGDEVTIITPGGKIDYRCSRSPDPGFGDAGTSKNRRPMCDRRFRVSGEARGGGRGRGVVWPSRPAPSLGRMALRCQAALRRLAAKVVLVARGPARGHGAEHRRELSFLRFRWLGSGEPEHAPRARARTTVGRGRSAMDEDRRPRYVV